jgi:type I restriction enzyme S subunit
VSRIEMGQSPDGRHTNEDGNGIPLIGGAADYDDTTLVPSRFTTAPTKVGEPGDLILCIRATIGKVAVADRPYCLGRGVAGLRPLNVDSEFLRYFLTQQAPSLDAAGTGSTFRQLDKRILTSWPIPLPPMTEQKRIVRKLDGLFERTRDSRGELSTISGLASRYREALLTAAFKGELTTKWRKSHRVSIDSWATITLGAASTDVRYGTSAKCRYDPALTPVLRIPNVIAGRIDLSDLKHASFSNAEIEKLALVPGDLLIIRSNGSLGLVGRIALVTEAAAGYLYAGYLIRVRLDLRRVDPVFIQLAFSEPSIRKRIESFAKSTSGVNNINAEQLRSLEFPCPSMEEQREIARAAAASLTRINSVSRETSRAITLLERFEYAVLERAFHGDLVLQEPSDKPMLLPEPTAEPGAVPRKQEGVSFDETRKTQMLSPSHDSVRDAIQQLRKRQFSFDELRDVVSVDYEALKAMLFQILAESQPIITQEFDPKAKTIVFRKATR